MKLLEKMSGFKTVLMPQGQPTAAAIFPTASIWTSCRPI
jgi:hypothetical protein